MVYIAKKCIGCQSNKRGIGGTTYAVCKVNLGRYHRDDLKIFRDHFCPCVECLVKATCTEPKLSIFAYGTGANSYEKCKLLRDQIEKFKQSI